MKKQAGVVRKTTWSTVCMAFCVEILGCRSVTPRDDVFLMNLLGLRYEWLAISSHETVLTIDPPKPSQEGTSLARCPTFDPAGKRVAWWASSDAGVAEVLLSALAPTACETMQIDSSETCSQLSPVPVRSPSQRNVSRRRSTPPQFSLQTSARTSLRVLSQLLPSPNI